MMWLCLMRFGQLTTTFYALFFKCSGCFVFSNLLITSHLLVCQPEELTNVLEICNIVFTSMFSLEMILKLTAFGSFNYLRNPYNVFDGVIVIIR